MQKKYLVIYITGRMNMFTYWIYTGIVVDDSNYQLKFSMYYEGGFIKHVLYVKFFANILYTQHLH